MSLTETESTASASAEPGVTDAGSSSAEPQGEKTLVDAVLGALSSDEDTPSSLNRVSDAATAADSVTGDATQDSDGEVDPDVDDLTPEEMGRLNDRTRARIETLLKQRADVTSELTSVQEQLKQAQPAIDNYGKIQNFLRANELTPGDAGSALNLAALIRSDPVEAFRQMQPIYARLAQIAGAVLPADLADEVRLGKITQARAQEISMSRASARAQQGQAERQTAQQAQAQEQERRTEHVRTIAKAGDALAAEKAKSDPDWKLKEPLVKTALQADLAQNGMPVDVADLRRRFADAIKSVERHIGAFRPTVRPIAKGPQGGTSPTSASSTKPKTMQEAIFGALDT